MKIRLGFVSNSSSCSFVICKSFLTEEQKEIIKNWYGELPDHVDDRGKDWEESPQYISGRIGYHLSDLLSVVKTINLKSEIVHVINY